MEYIAILHGESEQEAQQYLSYNSYYYRMSTPKLIMELFDGLYAFKVDLVGASLEDVRVIRLDVTGKESIDITRWM